MSESINYSDGPIEKRILNIINQQSQLSSIINVGVEHYASWPVRYHLGKCRGHLIRHLNFSGLSVLEFGAGMGALSRYIAETARHLTIVEGTEARLNIARQRLSDCQNWDAFQGNFQDFNREKKYDVVCFFGVFEYTEKYIKHPDPFNFVLSHAKSFLNPGGVILLAIENKNGIKYWAGAAEDHTGKIFDGICGYPKTKSIKTFSHHEMCQYFAKLNFNHITTHYPWPDYKMVKAVMTDDLYERDAQLAANIAAQHTFENYGANRITLFSETLATENIAKGNLLREFSNSYLFLASESDSAIKQQLLSLSRDKHQIAWLYTNYRKRDIKTTFFLQDNDLWVKKNYLHPQESTTPIQMGDEQFTQNLGGAVKVLYGEKLTNLLFNAAYYQDWERFNALFINFLNYIFNRYSFNAKYLQPQCVDACPQNAIVQGEEYGLFDLEYTAENPIPKSYFILRCLICLVREPQLFIHSPYASLHHLYKSLCQHFNISSNIKVDINREITFQKALHEFNQGNFLGIIPTFFWTFDKLAENHYMRDAHQELRKNSSLFTYSFQLLKRYYKFRTNYRAPSLKTSAVNNRKIFLFRVLGLPQRIAYQWRTYKRQLSNSVFKKIKRLLVRRSESLT